MFQVSYQELIKWHGIIVHGAKLLYALSEATLELPLSREKHMVVLMML
jgi:hypothetical protein